MKKKRIKTPNNQRHFTRAQTSSKIVTTWY